LTVQRAYEDLMDEFDQKDKQKKTSDIDFDDNKKLIKSFNEIKNSWIKYRTKNKAIFGVIKACLSTKDYYQSLENDINSYYDKMKGDFMDQLNKRPLDSFSQKYFDPMDKTFN